ncbi:MAG TPA: Flp pilus assembly protein CpaB [Bryobacteraceae bacterium]|nr:Flp pilus assembly protein CpaB [Bryobacteraceae bacterium]
MRLDRRFVIVMGFSLLWAFVVSAVFYRVAGGGNHRTRPQKPLVVAARPLPLGDTIGRDDVKIRQVPEDLFPEQGFSRVEDVLDRPVISPIQPDEPIVEARIAARGSGQGLAPMIPPGMRAISVRVNDVVGVAGFVLPGMRVDVLVTGRPPDSSDTYTRTVLQNVTVLSAGQTIQADPKSQSIKVPVVTLLVTPKQAEALTLADTQGHIQLVLRNSTDQKTADTPGQQLQSLYGVTARPAVPPPPVPEAAPERPRRVEVRRAVVAAPKVTAAPPPDEVVMIRGNAKTVEMVGPRAAN